MSMFSRRGFTGSILALFFRPGRAHGGETPSTPVASPLRTTLRRYRADAVILLFGIALYRRSGVGGGQVSVEETGEGAEKRRTLFFAAGSDPKRAHGLKRLGWIREVVLGSGAAPAEAEYFGVLTSSPEESLEQSRKSISAPQSGKTLYSAVSGRNTAGRSRSAVTHFEFSSDANWSDRALIDEAQSTFHGNVAWRETSWPEAANHAPPTFLLQMATLLEQRTKRASGRYVYNEQEYLLELETSPQGAVRGKVRNRRTGNQTAFRVWLENSPRSVVPIKIEFQPRSFLRLTFEALPDNAAPH